MQTPTWGRLLLSSLGISGLLACTEPATANEWKTTLTHAKSSTSLKPYRANSYRAQHAAFQALTTSRITQKTRELLEQVKQQGIHVITYDTPEEGMWKVADLLSKNWSGFKKQLEALNTDPIGEIGPPHAVAEVLIQSGSFALDLSDDNKSTQALITNLASERNLAEIENQNGKVRAMMAFYVVSHEATHALQMQQYPDLRAHHVHISSSRAEANAPIENIGDAGAFAITSSTFGEEIGHWLKRAVKPIRTINALGGDYSHYISTTMREPMKDLIAAYGENGLGKETLIQITQDAVRLVENNHQHESPTINMTPGRQLGYEIGSNPRTLLHQFGNQEYEEKLREASQEEIQRGLRQGQRGRKLHEQFMDMLSPLADNTSELER